MSRNRNVALATTADVQTNGIVTGAQGSQVEPNDASAAEPTTLPPAGSEFKASSPSDPVRMSDETLRKLAENEVDGYTLIPAAAAKGNHTVEVVEPHIQTEQNGVAMVVAKRLAN